MTPSLSAGSAILLLQYQAAASSTGSNFSLKFTYVSSTSCSLSASHEEEKIPHKNFRWTGFGWVYIPIYPHRYAPDAVCLSLTFVSPTQAIESFGNVSTPYGTLADIQAKFYEDRPRGTPPSGELNTRGVAEYSDFGPIERYISETVQDGS